MTRVPQLPIVHALRRLDDRISVQWNVRKNLWEVFYRRRCIPPWEPRYRAVSLGWWPILDNGDSVEVFQLKPIDQWHICFWCGPNGEYRDLDWNIIDHMRRLDTWKADRTKDLWLGMEAEEERREKSLERDLSNMTRGIIDDHGHRMSDGVAGLTGSEYPHWVEHHRANYRVGIGKTKPSSGRVEGNGKFKKTEHKRKASLSSGERSSGRGF